MNKIIKNVFIALILVFSISVLIGCNEQEAPKILLASNSQIEFFYDEVSKIDAHTETDAKIKYTSGDTKVATVDANGNVKAVGLGETVIRLQLEGYPDVKLEVNVKVKARDFVITGEDEVEVGSTITLEATDELGGDNIIWDTENSSIAIVSQSGVVRGVKAGKVNIMVVSNVTGDNY